MKTPAEYHRAFRERRAKAALCIRCGQASAKRTCRACAAKAAAYQVAKRAEKVAARVCVDCTEKATNGMRCLLHAARMVEYSKKYAAKRMVEQAPCARCGVERPAVPDWNIKGPLCQRCSSSVSCRRRGFTGYPSRAPKTPPETRAERIKRLALRAKALLAKVGK